MRNRQIYELTQTRSRRRSSIDSQLSSFNGQALNISQINQKVRPNYFQEIDNENASFSHNMIVSKQVQYRCLNGDYIQICDQDLQMKHSEVLGQQINNQNQISIFVNIKIDDASDLMGVWICRDIAQTFNADVLLFECYIAGDITQQSIKLVQYSILLADELFLTCQNIKEFNTFLILLSQIKPKIHQITIAELDPVLIDNQQLTELHQFCESVHFTAIFPSKIIDFQWQYYDYKQHNCKFIRTKKWRGFNLSCKFLFLLAKTFAEFVLDYEIINEIILNLIYNKIFESMIDNSFIEFLLVYETSIQINVIPILPASNIYELLVYERMKIQEASLDDLNLYKFLQFMQKIDHREKELFTLNKEIFECYETQKLTTFLNEVYYTKIYNAETLTVENMQNQIQNIFIKLNEILTSNSDEQNYESLKYFYSKAYQTFLTDILDKATIILEKEFNKEFCNFIDMIENLQIQIQIIEEKALYMIDYMEVIKKEIANLQKIITNMIKRNLQLEPQYTKSQNLQTEQHLLEVKQFQYKMIIQKEMKKMIKKEQKRTKKI